MYVLASFFSFLGLVGKARLYTQWPRNVGGQRSPCDLPQALRSRYCILPPFNHSMTPIGYSPHIPVSLGQHVDSPALPSGRCHYYYKLLIFLLGDRSHAKRKAIVEPGTIVVPVHPQYQFPFMLFSCLLHSVHCRHVCRLRWYSVRACFHFGSTSHLDNLFRSISHIKSQRGLSGVMMIKPNASQKVQTR